MRKILVLENTVFMQEALFVQHFQPAQPQYIAATPS